MPEERYLTTKEAAERLRVHPRTLHRWLREGRIKGARLGTVQAGYRIPESEVKRILQEGE